MSKNISIIAPQVPKPQESRWKFCPSCGGKITKENKFCSLCGYEFKD